jgi:hypothetical protein
MAKLCPTCRTELEHLRSCGSASFFCNTCNELVSRKKVIDTDTETADTTNEKTNEQNLPEAENPPEN